jgi:alpha-D-ribose 1-methylphosphonate 5-phosphate C-P lyase
LPATSTAHFTVSSRYTAAVIGKYKLKEVANIRTGDHTDEIMVRSFASWIQSTEYSLTAPVLCADAIVQARHRRVGSEIACEYYI